MKILYCGEDLGLIIWNIISIYISISKWKRTSRMEDNKMSGDWEIR